jgi:hypothetical protein
MAMTLVPATTADGLGGSVLWALGKHRQLLPSGNSTASLAVLAPARRLAEARSRKLGRVLVRGDISSGEEALICQVFSCADNMRKGL